MCYIRKILFLIVFALVFSDIRGQSSSNIDNNILYRKERTGYIMAHTSGFGLGYRSGKHKTYLRTFMWEIEGLNIKHSKEIKIASFYENSKNFVYGKLNNLYVIRGGVGQQHVLNGKPYWGGVEVRLFYFGGLSLGITKPVYLYIVKYNEQTGESFLELERFDPQQHYIGYIYGRGPFIKGFDGLGIYPGLYAKAGLSFEYAAKNQFVKTLECGVFVDGFYKNVPVMAYQNSQFLFSSLYISLHFGKRKN